MGESQVTYLRQNQKVIDIPGYKIQRTLGKGGMASVYLAIQESFEREVALKVMNPSLSDDSKFSERFLREAKIVSRLVHHNIVTVYDVGVHNQQHYLSMEYIPGFDIKHKRKHLRIRESLQVIKDVARALDYASKKGYVHRDVKPENIMLHEDDNRSVLMDFGIACLSDTASGMTQTGTAIGTPHYMSPEQAKGRAVDPRSDIYSLGVVLFLLVTGRVPYDADSAVAVGIKHVSEDIPLLPKSLRSLQPIINRVLAKEPADRYQSGLALIEAIESIDQIEYKAIELLTARSVNSTIDSNNTHTPTALSQAQQVVNVSKHNPDLTTVSAAALQTRNNTQVTSKTGARKASSSGTQRSVTSKQRAVTGTQPKVTKAGQKTTTSTQKIAATKTLQNGVSKIEEPIDRLAALTGTQTAAGQKYDPKRAVNKKWSDSESLFVDEEDRREHSVESSDKKNRWLLWVAASIVLVGAGSLYFRAYFPQPLSDKLEQTLQAGIQFSNDIGQKLGLVALPPKSVTSPPVATVESTTQSTSPIEAAVTTANDSLSAALQPEEPARSLREELSNDLSVAPHLAQSYRDILRDSPGMKNAEWGLRDIREFHDRYIRDALDQRDTETAQRYIASLEASFPGDLADDEKHLENRKQLESAQRAQIHIDKAAGFFVDDVLSVPPGANALESYQQALKVDAENPLALSGLQEIVDRYVELGQESYGKGSLVDALQSTNRGLAIDGANVDLLKLQQDSTRQLDRRNKINALLSAASQQMDSGNLLEPKGDSAYDRYKELLAFDRGNGGARAGLRELEKQLAFRIEGQINRNEFVKARELINSTNEFFPNSERMDALDRNLELAIEDDIIARQPKIPQLLISNTLPASINQDQQATINVERTIYFGFSYANFIAETSVVQVVLFDGSRTVEIAQVPVIVSGKDGVKFFQIDRPVEGFSAGGYNIDLILDDTKLYSAPFKVSNP